MTEYEIVLNLQESLFAALSDALKDAQDNAQKENVAATDIQRCWRGCTVRGKRTHMFDSCRSIQRVYRGHLARERCKKVREVANSEIRMGFFHYQAHIIQKSFRGYYSRRYYHDFFARKAYINSIMNKSEALKRQLQEHREKLEKIQAAQRENDAREEFEKVTENLHHLLSTSAQAGIYNSPYLQGNVPTAFNIPVEDHLRHGMTKYLKRTVRQVVEHLRIEIPPGQVVLLDRALPVLEEFALEAALASVLDRNTESRKTKSVGKRNSRVCAVYPRNRSVLDQRQNWASLMAVYQ